jgi:hypothetical protein
MRDSRDGNRHPHEAACGIVVAVYFQHCTIAHESCANRANLHSRFFPSESCPAIQWQQVLRFGDGLQVSTSIIFHKIVEQYLVATIAPIANPCPHFNVRSKITPPLRKALDFDYCSLGDHPDDRQTKHLDARMAKPLQIGLRLPP